MVRALTSGTKLPHASSFLLDSIQKAALLPGVCRFESVIAPGSNYASLREAASFRLFIAESLGTDMDEKNSHYSSYPSGPVHSSSVIQPTLTAYLYGADFLKSSSVSPVRASQLMNTSDL